MSELKRQKCRPVLDRFREKFIPEPNSGCWLWLAACHDNGYGAFGYGLGAKTMMHAHRASYLLFRGRLF